MLEKQLFRFTLLIAVLVTLMIGGASAHYFMVARDHESRNERAIDYQRRMEKVCKANPNFPACVSNEEYLAKRLTAINGNIEASAKGRALLPWAIIAPSLLLAAFYAIRWVATGHIRPLWVLNSQVACSNATKRTMNEGSMRKFFKVLKIILGVLFGLSAMTQLSYLPHFGIDVHFGIALFQGIIAYLFFRSAFRKNRVTATVSNAS